MTNDKMIKLTIDNKEIKAEEGITLLQACLDNEIYVPNLCFLKEMGDPPASCRICFVEIKGEDKPVTSCTEKVNDGMVVKTDTPLVRRLQRTAFQLLLSVQPCQLSGQQLPRVWSRWDWGAGRRPALQTRTMVPVGPREGWAR